MGRNMLLTISKEYIKTLEFNNKFLKNKKIDYESMLNEEKINVNFKNRNVYIIIEGEEIYIKYLKLPNIKNKHSLNSIIKNELIFMYGKKSENIFYTYTILNEENNELEVLVFCIYCDKLSCLEKCINDNRVKKINLIQFCFLNYFEKRIEEKDYVFLFRFNNSLYILGVMKKRMIANRIINEVDCNYDLIVDGLDYVLHKLDQYNGKVSKIYSANFNDKEFIDYINNLMKYKYVDLGSLSSNKMIEYFTITRK
ncbi:MULTISPECIES: hypothetical protein [Clostridium]|jgi:hypothetical protein|uniref:Uncharacterized protein n=2 Tax=Clostridium TaxID=1485 RepID=A0A151AQD3_9CLOT|nr:MULTISPECIES: hypothetical protein [Clostridium]MBE6078961.1 hypothetical protein [Clostridium lundense]KYH29803.1 hypothetical protein CLCOL_04410 [Clostridium colicanis DSM 13634]MBE6042738.1 hypothetical protein [Clostridium thermopalmarium]PRR75184.1 hypothetical protein CPAL_07360 [Clostridium thermopalmarium DSM 5974]PVZ27940.1 hypothetical protein LX19_00479 [Clostridium thermopalmarium DSM 5974]